MKVIQICCGHCEISSVCLVCSAHFVLVEISIEIIYIKYIYCLRGYSYLVHAVLDISIIQAGYLAFFDTLAIETLFILASRSFCCPHFPPFSVMIILLTVLASYYTLLRLGSFFGVFDTSATRGLTN